MAEVIERPAHPTPHRHRRVFPGPDEAVEDFLGRPTRYGAGYWLAVVVLAIIAAAGVVALIGMVAAGPEPRAKWGYVAGVAAFLLSTAHAAPILAVATRLAKGFWAISLRRSAELFALAGLVSVPLLIVLLFQLPTDFDVRHSIWFGWPGAPVIWDTVAFVLLGLAGLAALWVSAIPDWAAWAIRRPGSLARRLAMGFTGTLQQWQIFSAGVVVLGALYFTLYVFTHLLVVGDMAISLVPAWHSAIYPAYHAVSGLQAGVALTIVGLAFLRRFGGLERYIGLDAFWGAAKLLLALSLLFFYFTWAEFITYWYGRTPNEIALLTLFMFGPYMPLFVASFLLNFVLPFIILIWNVIRVSIAGPVVVASLVLLGNFIDRMRIYGASWSTADVPGTVHDLEVVPPMTPIGLEQVLVVAGALAGVALFYLLALKLIPAVSLWEYKNGLLLRAELPYMKTEISVIGKPR